MAPNPISGSIRRHASPVGDALLSNTRHSYLPTVFDLNFNLVTLVIIILLLTILGSFVTFVISRLKNRSAHSIKLLSHLNGRIYSSRKGTIISKGKVVLSQEEKPRVSSSSPALVPHHHRNRQHHRLTMTKKDSPPPSPPAVLRPQTRTPTPHSGPSRTISLAQGRYTGVLLPSSSALPRAVEAWRGIPYAQSTGGKNRFRPPVPLPPLVLLPSSSSSSSSSLNNPEVVTFRADRFGPICPGTAAQPSGRDGGFVEDREDCLNLNVYRPASYYDDEEKEKLPVIIYVHGGAFNAGSGTERNMASFVSWAQIPVLAVSFNYRVGALGFPSSVLAEREGCLNLGLRDQRFLFEWVRENIGAFGGDGGRVTIMGMSAGAHSIGYHLQSYTDPDTAPFQGAIMESGGPTARATLSPSHPRTEAQWQEFLLEAGIQSDSTTTTTTTDPDQIFPLLRSLPLDTLLRASNAVFSRYQDPIRWPFQPVIESDDKNGRLITDLPINTFRQGRYLKIPILTGFNSNEGTVFCSPRVDTNEDFLVKFTTMIPGFQTPDLAALCRVYPDPVTDPTSPYANVPPGFGRQWSRYEAAYAHYAYICPVLQTGHFYSNNDQKGQDEKEQDPSSSSLSPPVWIYHFAALSRPDFGGKSNHVDEAVLVSHDMNAIGQFPGLVATSDAIHGAWVRFIATGNPNPTTTNNNHDDGNNNNNSNTTTVEVWPRFSSPFLGDTDVSPGQLRRKSHHQGGGGSDDDGWGKVMMFGSGNDERMGGGNRGTPAKVLCLSTKEVDECQFWWERVELSEGLGRRLLAGRRAKL